MIKLGELVMILDLHRQGLSVSAIARQCCLDRKTVRRYIGSSSGQRRPDGTLVLMGRTGDIVAQRSLDVYDAIGRQLAQGGRAWTSLLRRTPEHKPFSAKYLAEQMAADAWSTLTWREGTNTELASRFAAVRLRPASKEIKSD